MLTLPDFAEELFDTLSRLPFPVQCPTCGCEFVGARTTFFSPDLEGKVWIVPLPLCAKCDTKKDTPPPWGGRASIRNSPMTMYRFRSEERRVGKECRSRWSP